MQFSPRRLIYPSVILVLLSLLSPGSKLEGGTYNSQRNIGDVAFDWKDLPGIDGKLHSLQDLKDRDVVVVVFTCNTCAYSIDYEDRINALARRYADPSSKVGIVAINSNQVKEDLLPAMQERAKAKNFQFPYLYDESQTIAPKYGAVRTPEFFVLNQKRQIVYMGAMDDHSKESEVKKTYVIDAIEATLAGKVVATAETPPVGCLIRFARQRKK